MNKSISYSFILTIFGNKVEIEERTDVSNINNNHIFKFFCILFSSLVINNNGTSTHSNIHKKSFKYKDSLNIKKLIAVIITGKNVLYTGKNIIVSILFKACTLDKVDKK